MTTITKPKWQFPNKAEEFRVAMVALGARWDNTFDYWMVPDGREAEAEAIRAEFPDRPEPQIINGATLCFAPKGSKAP